MDALVELGASFHAYTLRDFTMYETVAPVEHLDELLELELYRFADPLAAIPAQTFDAERMVVLRELEERNHDIYERIVDASARSLFPSDHPYHKTGRSLDGTRELHPADVASFWRETTTPIASACTSWAMCQPPRSSHG